MLYGDPLWCNALPRVKNFVIKFYLFVAFCLRHQSYNDCVVHNETCQWNQFDLCVSLESQIDNSSIVNATVTEVCLCVVCVCVCARAHTCLHIVCV